MSGAPGEECLVFAVLARSHLKTDSTTETHGSDQVKSRISHGNTRKHTEIYNPNRRGFVLFYSSVSFRVIPWPILKLILAIARREQDRNGDR